MASAWGDSWGSAWGDSWGASVTPVVTTEARGGGGGTLHLPTGRRRSKEELRAERERLGILPKPVVLKAKPRRLPAQAVEAELDRELAFARIRQTQEDELVLVLLMH